MDKSTLFQSKLALDNFDEVFRQEFPLAEKSSCQRQNLMRYISGVSNNKVLLIRGNPKGWAGMFEKIL